MEFGAENRHCFKQKTIVYKNHIKNRKSVYIFSMSGNAIVMI